MSNNLKQMITDNQRIWGIKPWRVRMANQVMNNDTETSKKQKQNKNKNKNLKKMKNTTIVAMAISKGREVAEPVKFKRYIGIASCNLLAINPTKAELDKIYGRDTEKEPVYIGETEINGVKVPQVRIDFIFRLSDNKGNPLDNIFRKSVFLVKAKMTNRDNTKVQVVDEYGNTAWVTNEQCANHEIPIYSNGPASISKNYRPMYRGEETIMKICKVFLNIPDIRIDANQNTLRYNFASKEYKPVADATDGLIRFDTIESFFTGNFKEIQEIPSYQPKNLIKILLGVRNVDGKQYQDVYDMVLRNNDVTYTYLKNDLNIAKSNGRYPNTEFKICDFQEYTVTPTTFTQAVPTNNPFDTVDDIF